MRYRNLVWRLGAAGAGSIQIYPFHKLYPDLGWEIQGSWDYSATPWRISNTHKPCGAWEGRWQGLPATLWDSQPMAHVSWPRSSNRSVWLGYGGDGSLFTPIISCCLQHLSHLPVLFLSITFGTAGLVCSTSAALLSLALGCFPKPHILGCSSWLSLTCSHQLNAINITSASEIAFVSNKATFWLPFLWPELQCKLQGASPWHHESHLYSYLNFPLQTQRSLKNHSNKTKQRLHPLPEQLGSACEVHQGHRLWARRGCSVPVGQSPSHWSMWESDRK